MKAHGWTSGWLTVAFSRTEAILLRDMLRAARGIENGATGKVIHEMSRSIERVVNARTRASE